MEQLGLVFTMLLIVWGVVTSVLAVLVIYRATLSSHEDDQIFITAGGEQHHEQEAIIAKITQLSRPIIALTALWSVLLLSVAGVWLYRGFKSF